MGDGFTWLEFAAVLLTGLLAEEELIVRWGVHPALASLSEAAAPASGIQARQALVRRWEAIDVFRASAAPLGFAALLASALFR